VGVQLKLPEVARRLGVSEKTARRYVKAGMLPSMFVGNAYRVSERDVEEYLERARVTPGKAQAPPSQHSLFNGLEEERRLAIPYDVFRAALESFCDYWQPALSGERPLDRQGFEDFKAGAASLSGMALVVMGFEKQELGQQYDEEGDPVFYTERSEFGPAVMRFHDLAIRMGKIGKERFGEDLTSDPEMGQLLDLFPKAS
jgi:excisionase family DNA binding protein